MNGSVGLEKKSMILKSFDAVQQPGNFVAIIFVVSLESEQMESQKVKIKIQGLGTKSG